MSTVAEPSAGTAKFERVHGTDVLTGTARSRTAVPLPSDVGPNAAVSPVWSMHGQWGQTGESGERRVPLLEGDGTQLTDENGQLLYDELGWCLMRAQNGYALCDNNGHLCFEEIDEDQLDSDEVSSQTSASHGCTNGQRD